MPGEAPGRPTGRYAQTTQTERNNMHKPKKITKPQTGISVSVYQTFRKWVVDASYEREDGRIVTFYRGFHSKYEDAYKALKIISLGKNKTITKA